MLGEGLNCWHLPIVLLLGLLNLEVFGDEAQLMATKSTATAFSKSADSWKEVLRVPAGVMLNRLGNQQAVRLNGESRTLVRVRLVTCDLLDEATLPGEENLAELWVSTDQLEGIETSEIRRVSKLNSDRTDLPAILKTQRPSLQQAWLEVQQAIEENEKLDAPLPDPYFARAEILAKSGDFDSALRDYLKAMQLTQYVAEDVSVYRAYFDRLQSMLSGYDSKPRPVAMGDARFHFITGFHSFWQQDLSSAIKHFSNAIALDPRDSKYWYYRGLSFRLTGNDKRATHDALIGAHLEWKDGAPDEIGSFFQRVQGSNRNWLESFRRGDPPSISAATANN